MEFFLRITSRPGFFWPLWHTIAAPPTENATWPRIRIRIGYCGGGLFGFGFFWYFWLAIQNTADRKVLNLFHLLAVFISFSGRAAAETKAQSLAVRPRVTRFTCLLPPFLGKKKRERTFKKEENRAQTARADLLSRRRVRFVAAGLSSSF
jgi:hypothetical protein